MIENKTFETSKIDEYAKVCQFYKDYIDKNSPVPQRIIERYQAMQRMWLAEVNKKYPLPKVKG